jgi:diguanylate cyclase (GGDEF)-like protein/PAS domain S-box-containing protein
MNLLAAAHFFAFVLYAYVGIHVGMAAPRSRVHRTFFFLAAALAWWALIMTFGHASGSRADYWRWLAWERPAAAVVPALLLHFFLVLTESRPPSRTRRASYLAIYLAAAVFLVHGLDGPLFVRDLERTAAGWVEIPELSSPWFWAFTVYYGGCALAGFLLAWRWGRAVGEDRGRRLHARVIVRTGLASLLLVVLDEVVAPAAVSGHIPTAPAVLIAVWVAGIAWAVGRHGFLALTPQLAAHDLVEAIPDALVLNDPDGRVLAVNGAFERIFGFRRAEVVGRPWDDFLATDETADRRRIGSVSRRNPVVGFETSGRTKSGDTVPLIASVTRVRDPEGGDLGSVAILRDDSERRRVEERIRRLAHHDSLTDLPNRLLFRDRLQQALHRARRYKHTVGVLVLDVDRLKEVNDTQGHAAGDLLLQTVARRLRGCVRDGDTTARLSGDEFAVALPERRDEEEVRAVARRVVEALGEPVELPKARVRSGASVGVALFPDHAQEPEGLLGLADAAMYRAKQAGRNDFRVYDPAAERSADGPTAERRFGRALEAKEFLVHYQPQVELAGGKVIGVEALVRWLDPQRGLIPPLEFLPLAEETGLIVPLGEWVLRTSCAQVAAWRAAGLPPVGLAVNLSGRQLLREDLVDTVLAALARTGLAPGDLELDVTEEATQRSPERALAVLRRLREVGVRLAVDDLGTGQTSLAFLARFPGHTLKIAQAFVRELPGRAENRAVVEGLLALAGDLGFERVVAEGVETEEQLAYLRGVGCPVVQGYATGRPAGAHAIAVLLGGGRMPGGGDGGR